MPEHCAGAQLSTVLRLGGQGESNVFDFAARPRSVPPGYTRPALDCFNAGELSVSTLDLTCL